MARTSARLQDRPAKVHRAARACEKDLGPKFDLRAFHDEMLSAGVLPLDLLDHRTDRWIAAQKAQSTQQATSGAAHTP
ncbi:DUF885 family protein [Tunturiibacter gelidiferens]